MPKVWSMIGTTCALLIGSPAAVAQEPPVLAQIITEAPSMEWHFRNRPIQMLKREDVVSGPAVFGGSMPMIGASNR